MLKILKKKNPHKVGQGWNSLRGMGVDERGQILSIVIREMMTAVKPPRSNVP